MRRIFWCAALFLVIPYTISGQELKKQTWQVGDLEREALVHLPEKAKSEPTPVVFAFHGHGGNSLNAGKTFKFHQLWPEAIVVYPQGVKTPGLLTDPEGTRTGWQSFGDAYKGRDLNFFDAMLAWLRKEYKVDNQRIYSTGHSNGGGFTYLLWAERGDVFAAMGPSAAVGLKLLPKLTAKPMIHIAGEADPLVKFEWQNQMISRVKSLNATSAEGKAWLDVKNATIYASKDGFNVVTLIHPGKHNYLPASSEAIVKFFKATAKVDQKVPVKP